MSDTAAVHSPAAEVRQWLDELEEALALEDAERAAALFADDGFWRDLVAFTWNIRTLEGPAEMRDMLEARSRDGARAACATTEEPAEADGVTDGVARVRDRGRPGARAPAPARRQGVDVPHDALGAQGPRGAPATGAPDGRRARRRTGGAGPGSSGASARPASSATSASPTC